MSSFQYTDQDGNDQRKESQEWDWNSRRKLWCSERHRRSTKRISRVRLKQQFRAFEVFSQISINEKNLKSEIETVHFKMENRCREKTINEKNLKSEIETCPLCTRAMIWLWRSTKRISRVRLKQAMEVYHQPPESIDQRKESQEWDCLSKPKCFIKSGWAIDQRKESQEWDWNVYTVENLKGCPHSDQRKESQEWDWNDKTIELKMSVALAINEKNLKSEIETRRQCRVRCWFCPADQRKESQEWDWNPTRPAYSAPPHLSINEKNLKSEIETVYIRLHQRGGEKARSTKRISRVRLKPVSECPSRQLIAIDQRKESQEWDWNQQQSIRRLQKKTINEKNLKSEIETTTRTISASCTWPINEKNLKSEIETP